MAKKLLYDYTFDASAKTVAIAGHVDVRKLLFINNATRGTTIYALGDPDLKVTNTAYNAATNITTYTLTYDTAGASHADTDKLQIFIDEEGAEFKPTETFIDPVSKLRVSNPNTLIDTDFEYSLQSTKWETLERIHQIPSFYSSTGDVPLQDVASITSVNGSRDVTVKTAAVHGLTNGIPIDIRGLTSQTAEGTFIIKSIPDDKTFVYEANITQTFTGNIETVYANVIIGRFYVGSKLTLGEYSAVTTDGTANSTLTITTPVKSNYNIGTQFYITNSIAVRRKEFDGRSFTSNGAVDWSSTISSMETTAMTLWNPEGQDTIQYLVANASHMNSATDTITHYSGGSVQPHGLLTGDFMFMKYVNGNVTGFTAAGQTGTDASSTNGGNGIYYVIRVDDTTYKLASSPTNCASGTGVSFSLSDTAQSATQLEMKLFGRGYSSTVVNPFEFDIIEAGDPNDPGYGRKQRYFYPEAIDTAQETICIPRHQFKDGQPVIFTRGPSPNSTPGNMDNNRCYYIKYVDADNIKLTTSFNSRDPNHDGPYYGAGVGSEHNITGQGTLYTWGAPFALWPCIKLARDITNNASGGSQNNESWYKRNRIICEHSIVNFQEGDKVAFRSTSGTPGNVNQMSNNYSMDPIENYIYYVRYPAINESVTTKNFEFSLSKTPNGPLHDIDGWPDTENSFVYKLQTLSTANTWYSPQHGFTNNQDGDPDYWLKYRFDSQHSTGSSVGGMSSDYWYWMIPLNNNHFRVAYASSDGNNDQPTNPNYYNQDQAKSYVINITSFSGNGTNFRHKFKGQNIDNPYVDTFKIDDHGFVEGNAVKYNSNGNPVIGGLQNGQTYYCRNVSQNRFELSSSINGPRLNISGGSATSSPNHYFEDVSAKGSIDGAYEISARTGSDGVDYAMATTTQIFGKSLVFYPQQTVDCKQGRFYIKDHGLKTGVTVRYTVPSGGTAIGNNPQPTTAQQTAGYTYLTHDTDYYVIRISKNWFCLASTLANAKANIRIKEFFNLGNDQNDNYQHTLYATSVYGETTGPGRMTYTTRDKTWDGSNDNNVNTYQNYVTIGTHQFQNGDYLEYNGFAGATPIQGLQFGEKYYIHRWSSTYLSFHKNRQDAYRRRNPIKLFGSGTGTLHILRNATGVLKGTVDRGRWNSSTEYFVGDIVVYETSSYDYWYVATEDSLDHWDDLRYNYNDSQNRNQNPPGGSHTNPPYSIYNRWWRRLNDYTESSTFSGDMETSMINQFTPGEEVLLDDERYCGYGYGYGYFNYERVQNGGTQVTVPSSSSYYHNFQMGDAVHYRNEGKWMALEAQASTLPTDYGGLEDGNIYYVNPINYYQFTMHQSPNEARQGINPITLAYSSGNSSYYSYHRFYRMESDVIPAKIVSISDQNEMTVEEPSTPRVIEFDPQEIEQTDASPATSIVVCDTSNNTIFLKTVEGVPGADGGFGGGKYYGYDKYLMTGTRVVYSRDEGDSNISGFSKDNSYFVINLGDGYYKFAGGGGLDYSYRQNAYSGQRLSFGNTGTGNNHSFTIASENYNNVPYIIPTAVYVKPSSYALHRPFDGGVEINAGKSADSSIVRQTRRYFRYQSGKGLQYSTATNFNPPIEVRSLIGGTDGSGNDIATVTTRKPHFLETSDTISMADVTVASGTNEYVGNSFTVASVTDEFTFTYSLNGAPSDTTPAGFPTLHKNGWSNSIVRAGMFDDQNGFFFEYDGSNLMAVRRSSTMQTAGTISVTKDSQTVTGNGTIFQKQLAADDYVVIRGQSYRIAHVQSDGELYLTTAYKGIDATNVIMTKTIDTKTAASNFNLDKCDGTGQSGFELDVKRLQMAYIDYSWYGGGKIRYGFKDQHGRVFYAHQYVHSNYFNEAYFRSGNLPARYEVSNVGDRTTGNKFAPSLYHWGASVIMDGQFEDDKAYLFSASSDQIWLRDQKEDGDEWQANREYPLLSIRLAPSVDAGVKGALGARDLINRMQLQLKAVSISLADGGTSDGADVWYSSVDPKKSCTIRLILNGDLSSPSWIDEPSPSLSQIVYHTHNTTDEFAKVQDRVSNGITILEFRAAANDTTEQILGEVATLGNSIMGGDYTYPNGPDTLTIVAIPDHGYTSSSYQFTACSARITWTEAQA